jgi:prepilin signal peptidase PulO-like enzyme (type II secretory pathway)
VVVAVDANVDEACRVLAEVGTELHGDPDWASKVRSEPDVLGVFGSLRGPWPDWLAPRPALAGLALVAAVFAVWCLVGTEPDEPRREGGGSAWWAAWLRPRPVAVTTGAAVLLGGWFVGGDHWRGLVSSLVGIAVSGGIIWLTRAGASRALGREAMGLGDVTLMAMVGAWLGWQPCLLACFLAVFIGLVHGVTQLVVRSETELPFGPSLCLAAAVVVVGGIMLIRRKPQANPGRRRRR